MRLGTIPQEPYGEFKVIKHTQIYTNSELLAFSVRLQYIGQVLCIASESGAIYLSRDQARAFFGFPED